MLDIRPTSEQALEYIWFGRQCLDLARRSGFGGAKAIRDGRLLVICKYTLHHATLITLSQGDFTMHPRSGPLRAYSVNDDTTIPGVNGGGYTRSGEMVAELAARLPYPLVDDDHGTFIVSIDGEDLEVTWADQGDENYGNLWWQGTGDDPPVLSWRGPPSVQFGLPTTASISGLTQRDPAGAHTPFHCYIYADGSRIHGPQPLPDSELATLVAGACYATDEANRQWLVAVCVTNRDSRYFLQVWRSADKGMTWEMIAEFLSVRASSPAFISRNGRVFVYAGNRYEIDATVSTVHRGASMPTAQAGARTITGAGGYGSSYEFSGGVGYCWPGLNTDGEMAYSTYTETAAFSSTGSGDVSAETTTVPIYRGNPATALSLELDFATPAPCSLAGGYAAVIRAIVPEGSYCGISWAGVDCAKGALAAKRLDACDSAFSVSATLQPQGITAILERSTALPGIVVSGPEQVYAGAAYNAANTVGTVSWSITKGAISQSGVITDPAGCGCATITATDACGRTGTLVVRMPTGIWVSDNNQVLSGASGLALNDTFASGMDCNCNPTYVVAHWTLCPTVCGELTRLGVLYSIKVYGLASAKVISGGKRYSSTLIIQFKGPSNPLIAFDPWPAITTGISDIFNYDLSKMLCAHDGLNIGCCNCQSLIDGQPYSYHIRSNNNYSETWSCP